MSVLVYAESWNGSFRKSTYEVISYAKELAKKTEGDLIAISFGDVSRRIINIVQIWSKQNSFLQ